MHAIDVMLDCSSISVWAKRCDDLDLEEPENSELDKFIDQLYEDLDRGQTSLLTSEGFTLISRSNT